ncbi:MAG: proton-conducting transporter membrane subunit, partial [Chloroflexota bacterium]|nr:proton-conducting transporter membrane subunit [Chloroflexota bacterium]
MQTLLFLLPQLILFLSAMLVFGIDLVGSDKKKWLPTVALGGGVASLAVAVYLMVGVKLPTEPILGGMLAMDTFGLFFQIFAALVVSLVIISSLGFMWERTPYPAEFYSFILIAGLSIALVAAAADLIMVYVAFELLSITSYILTGYLRDDPKSSEAAVKYFLFGAMASAAMLYGMSLLYGVSGSTNLTVIAGTLQGADASLRWVVYPAIVLLLVGFGFKIAAVPFHQWSPDAYEGAPTPVTAFLSVGPKAAGFAVLMRVLFTALPNFSTDWMALLSAISMMTMTLGNLVAISQKNIKRMLAYSSIAHAGYMLIGLVSWDMWESGSIFDGVSGVLIYLLVYLFANLGAFAVVIAFERATGS